MSDKNTADRRDFIKQSTAAAVGATVLGHLATPSGAYAQGDETVKVGLIGCGGRGTGAATQALSTAGLSETGCHGRCVSRSVGK
jgi:myo-inositol 2-dehydrogenase/D-chiro-inositol 1-dehydrogenase